MVSGLHIIRAQRCADVRNKRFTDISLRCVNHLIVACPRLHIIYASSRRGGFFLSRANEFISHVGANESRQVKRSVLGEKREFIIALVRQATIISVPYKASRKILQSLGGPVGDVNGMDGQALIHEIYFHAELAVAATF